MDWLPDTLRRISLPSAVFFTLFAWNGVAYIGLARILPLKNQQKLRFYLFGLSSLCLAGFSFATFELYSAVDFGMSLFCDQLQMATMVPLFIFFILFTASYLELPRLYFTRIVPLVTLLFVPFLFWDGMYFRPAATWRTFAAFGYTTRITEAALGPAYFLFLAWTLPHVFFAAWRWLGRYRKDFQGWGLPLGVLAFVLAVLNDIMVNNEVYHFFYVLEFGFAIFVCTMAFQLFRYYVQTVRELEEKTNEVSALNEEIQFLVSAISHDLKAPLISIRGFSALLGEMKEEESEKRRNFLKRVEENAEQMLEWLDDLIRFIKVGWVAGDTEAVDLAKVSQEVEGLLAGPCTERKIRIDWPASWPQLFSSSKGVKQILLNLLQNSVKFSPSDKIVRVECFREHAAIQIWVEDEGPGVPEELRERIFQPFFRHHRDVPGSGMGLAIVKKTAEKLGGRAWLDTEYRSGARFCVYLPDRGRRPEL